MFRPQHMGVLHSAPMVFQINCFVYSCSVNTTLAYSFRMMWGWFRAVWCAVGVVHKCLGAPTRVLRTNTDGDVWGPSLLPHAVLQSQLGTVLGLVRLLYVQFDYVSLFFHFVPFLLLRLRNVTFPFISLPCVMLRARLLLPFTGTFSFHTKASPPFILVLNLHISPSSF